jgi:hypothetical protein
MGKRVRNWKLKLESCRFEGELGKRRVSDKSEFESWRFNIEKRELKTREHP